MNPAAIHLVHAAVLSPPSYCDSFPAGLVLPSLSPHHPHPHPHMCAYVSG